MCSELFIVVVVLTACVGYMYQCVVIVVSATRCIDGRRLVRLALVLALCWKHSDVEVVVRGLRRGVVARLALAANFVIRKLHEVGDEPGNFELGLVVLQEKAANHGLGERAGLEGLHRLADRGGRAARAVDAAELVRAPAERDFAVVTAEGQVLAEHARARGHGLLCALIGLPNRHPDLLPRRQPAQRLEALAAGTLVVSPGSEHDEGYVDLALDRLLEPVRRRERGHCAELRPSRERGQRAVWQEVRRLVVGGVDHLEGRRLRQDLACKARRTEPARDLDRAVDLDERALDAANRRRVADEGRAAELLGGVDEADAVS